MTIKSKTLALSYPVEYMHGVTDRQTLDERDLDAYPFSSLRQQAYEYGWVDQNEGKPFAAIARSTIRYRLWEAAKR